MKEFRDEINLRVQKILKVKEGNFYEEEIISMLLDDLSTDHLKGKKQFLSFTFLYECKSLKQTSQCFYENYNWEDDEYTVNKNARRGALKILNLIKSKNKIMGKY